MATTSTMKKLFVLICVFATIYLQIIEAQDDDEIIQEESILESAPQENNVLVLGGDIFDDVISEAGIILVEFYAPWCGHCKQLIPHYEAAADRLKDIDPPIALAKVDATVETELAKRFDVSGYPTLKWFRDGQAFDYDGPREEDGIVEYMTSRADPNWKPPPEAVITLTQKNFREIVDNEELMLVEFYAPWCGHCKKLAPEYEKAAQQLQYGESPIKLGKVDATVESDLGKEFGVSGYPTLKLFRNGKDYEYKGGRDKYGIVDYMEKQRGDPSKEKSDLKSVQSFLKLEDVTIVAFFDDSEQDTYVRYQEAVNDLREDYDLGHTFDAAAAKHYKVNSGSVVAFMPERFYTKHEQKYYIFNIEGDTTHDAITKFIQTHDKPLVGHYNLQNNEKRYMVRPLVILFMFVDFTFDHRQVTQMWRNKFADIAKDHKDLTFVIANEDDFKEVFSIMGFDDNGEELNVGILGEGDRKYPMEAMDEWDSDSIKDFIAQYKNGEIKPRLKSQPVPKKQGLVKTVVGKSFEKIVLDPKKDVLIEFYAPWCGHCKSLEPIYKKLAKAYKHSKKLVIAKMDATANEMPHPFKADGYPTIYFSVADNKKDPIKYEGQGRELDDLIEFIETEHTVELMPRIDVEEQKKDEL